MARKAQVTGPTDQKTADAIYAEVNDRRKRFVRELAEFLAGRQAEMSIGLQMGSKEAKQWQRLRQEIPLAGYPTVDEAEEQLKRFLGL